MSLRAYQIVSLAAAARITADANSTGVDVRGYSGEARIALNSSATEEADDTLNVKIQDSADNSTDWQDVSGLAFTQVTSAAASTQVIGFNIDKCRRYIRVVSDVGGTTPAVTRAVTLVAKLDRT